MLAPLIPLAQHHSTSVLQHCVLCVVRVVVVVLVVAVSVADTGCGCAC